MKRTGDYFFDKLNNKTFLILTFLFLLSLTLNLSYLLYWSGIGLDGALSFNDEFDYVDFAKNLVDNGELIKTNHSLGYPFFISFFYYISDNIILITRIIQAIIVALFPIQIYLISQIYFNKRISLIAAFITALLPAFKIYIPFLLSELLYIFVLLFSYYFFIKSFKDKKMFNLLLSLLFLILAISIRIESIIFLLLLIILLLKRFDLINNKRKLVIFIIIIVILIPSVMSSLYFLNKNRFSDIILLPVGINLWTITYDSFYKSDQLTINEFRSTHFANLSSLDKSALALNEFIKLSKHEPQHYINGVIKNFINIIFVHQNNYNNYLKEIGFSEALRSDFYKFLLLKSLLFILHMIIIIFGILGGILLFFHNKKICLLYSIPIISRVLLVFIIFSEDRHQLVILPFLIILASYTFYNIYLIIVKNDSMNNKVRHYISLNYKTPKKI